MNIRCLVSVTVLALLGCSMPPPDTTPREATPVRAGVRVLERAPLAYVEPPAGYFAPPPQPCHVGTKNCLDLDSKPFAPCLLSAGRCSPGGKVMPLESDTMVRTIPPDPDTVEHPGN